MPNSCWTNIGNLKCFLEPCWCGSAHDRERAVSLITRRTKLIDDNIGSRVELADNLTNDLVALSRFRRCKPYGPKIPDTFNTRNLGRLSLRRCNWVHGKGLANIIDEAEGYELMILSRTTLKGEQTPSGVFSRNCDEKTQGYVVAEQTLPVWYVARRQAEISRVCRSKQTEIINCQNCYWSVLKFIINLLRDIMQQRATIAIRLLIKGHQGKTKLFYRFVNYWQTLNRVHRFFSE